MKRPTSMLSGSSVLLVEGKDDEHVIRHFCKYKSVPLSFDIKDKGGIDPLLDSIVPEIKSPGRQTIGILLDANNDLVSRWRSVRCRIAPEGIQIPKNPDPLGTVIDTDGKPRIGLWLMPDNNSPGEIEDFVVGMIPSNDSVWPLSRQYINGIPIQDRKFKEGKRLRAQLHAWLAAREDPRKMGQAITVGDLKVDGNLCEKFSGWLVKLFSYKQVL